jgi:hypothetical protein
MTFAPVLFKGLFDGEHYFILEPLEDGKTKLTHGETFSGILVPLFAKTLQKTERGFMRMNQDLNERLLTL